jgi:hypothetical protein
MTLPKLNDLVDFPQTKRRNLTDLPIALRQRLQQARHRRATDVAERLRRFFCRRGFHPLSCIGAGGNVRRSHGPISHTNADTVTSSLSIESRIDFALAASACRRPSWQALLRALLDLVNRGDRRANGDCTLTAGA